MLTRVDWLFELVVHVSVLQYTTKDRHSGASHPGSLLGPEALQSPDTEPLVVKTGAYHC